MMKVLLVQDMKKRCQEVNLSAEAVAAAQEVEKDMERVFKILFGRQILG